MAPTVEAKSGCCSWHGGVSSDGCGCNDGSSLSATCAPYYSCSVYVSPKTESNFWRDAGESFNSYIGKWKKLGARLSKNNGEVPIVQTPKSVPPPVLKSETSFSKADIVTIDNVNDSIDKQIRFKRATCDVKGIIFSEKFKQTIIANGAYVNYFVTPKSYYSEQRNTCLLENGYNYPTHGGDGTYMQIANIDSDTLILRSSHDVLGNDINPSQGVVSYTDFMLKAKDIMSK